MPAVGHTDNARTHARTHAVLLTALLVPVPVPVRTPVAIRPPRPSRGGCRSRTSPPPSSCSAPCRSSSCSSRWSTSCTRSLCAATRCTPSTSKPGAGPRGLDLPLPACLGPIGWLCDVSVCACNCTRAHTHLCMCVSAPRAHTLMHIVCICTIPGSPARPWARALNALFACTHRLIPVRTGRSLNRSSSSMPRPPPGGLPTLGRTLLPSSSPTSKRTTWGTRRSCRTSWSSWSGQRQPAARRARRLVALDLA